MKIYYSGRSLDHRIYVSPAEDYPDISAWHEHDGRPKQFEVHFKYGMADVDDHLGNYMIEKGLARKSKVITEVA